MSTDLLLLAAAHGDDGAMLVLDDWCRERGQRLSDLLTPEPETFELTVSYGSGYGFGDGNGSGYGLSLIHI